MDTPLSPAGLYRAEQPPQWTVGQLRAELVAITDDAPLVVDVCLDPAGESRRRVPLIGAGYGHGIDPSDPLFDGQEYPLTAAHRSPDDGAARTPALPSFAQMLDQARHHLSAARDELRSDWATGHGPATPEQAHARVEALELIGRAKAAIDQATR